MIDLLRQNSRRHIGHARDAEHLHPHVVGHDHFGHGGHPHHVRADRAQITNLRRSLIAGTRHRRVHALVDRDAEFRGHPFGDVAIGLRVGIGHIGKARAQRIVVRAHQRIRALQVDVIADQHQPAALQRQVDAARRVGEHHGPRADGLQHAHSEGHLLHVVAFVQVRPPGHHRHVQLAQLADDQLPGVSHRGGVRPARNIRVRDVLAFSKFVSERAQSAAQHQANGGPHVGVALYVSFCFVGHSNIPAMQADMKFAMVPAATARRPSLARSLLRVGASAPMPPI